MQLFEGSKRGQNSYPSYENPDTKAC